MGTGPQDEKKQVSCNEMSFIYVMEPCLEKMKMMNLISWLN